MKEIKPKIPKSLEAKGVTIDNYLSDDGCVPVENFADLRQKIAELSCLHPDSVLFFRGQHTDYKRNYGKMGDASTFLPSIYRENPKSEELLKRWNMLEFATYLLVKELNNLQDANKEEFKFLKAKKLAQ